MIKCGAAEKSAAHLSFEVNLNELSELLSELFQLNCFTFTEITK